MAKRPMTYCSADGCSNLVRGRRYCRQHSVEISSLPAETRFVYDDTKRKSSYERGYNLRWRKYRKLFLNRNPLCEVCGSAASVVDHKIRHEGDNKAFWDENNHQALCASCHAKKTSVEMKGLRKNIRKKNPSDMDIVFGDD